MQQQREILRQAETLTALGSLLAGVAHELDNPLSIVVGHALPFEELAADPNTSAGSVRSETEQAGTARPRGRGASL